jgi:hypothetical protein
MPTSAADLEKTGRQISVALLLSLVPIPKSPIGAWLMELVEVMSIFCLGFLLATPVFGQKPETVFSGIQSDRQSRMP